MRTQEEKTQAIERLKFNKTKCSRFNCFGEDNHEKINVMIDVIKENRNESYIYKTYTSEDENDIGVEMNSSHAKWSSAISALGFVIGEIELKDILYPEK
jgi:hypothetical protein